MGDVALYDSFVRIGLAALIGFLIGLERTVVETSETGEQIRDFVLFALFGAISAFAAEQFESIAIMIATFVAFLIVLFSAYWAEMLKKGRSARDTGVTSEGAAILTFLLGALVMKGQHAIAIAVAVLMLAVLSRKKVLKQLRERVQQFEINATIRLLVITFIVLPLLPRQPLDGFFTFALGTVEAVNETTRQVSIDTVPGQELTAGNRVEIYGEDGRPLGELVIESATSFDLSGVYEGEFFERVAVGTEVRSKIGIEFVTVMLSAITPYRVWLIVVLVSFISFIGYVLVKLLGSTAGIGLTGLVGGLASSTITTLSFARRSKESPSLNRHFAVAILLASSMMFPRLLVQVSVVNQALMRRMALPILVMGGVGFAIAGLMYLRARREPGESETLELSNPFQLSSALKFGLVFMSILVVTRLAIHYLGDAWLPVVAFVSGLTDADAIAFSVSDAQQAGAISLDWASFNAVLGAVANTIMKLGLVMVLGSWGLARRLLLAVIVISLAGLITMWFYYDFSGIQQAAEPILP